MKLKKHVGWWEAGLNENERRDISRLVWRRSVTDTELSQARQSFVEEEGQASGAPLWSRMLAFST